MKKTILLISIFVFALANISMAKGLDYGERGWGHRQGRMGIPSSKWWKRPDVAGKVGITEEEKEKLDNMYYKYRYLMIDLRSQVKKERLELEQLIDSKAFNDKACLDQFTKLQKAKNTVAAEKFRFLVQVRKLLNLDRFQQLKEQVRKYRMKGRRGKQGIAIK